MYSTDTIVVTDGSARGPFVYCTVARVSARRGDVNSRFSKIRTNTYDVVMILRYVQDKKYFRCNNDSFVFYCKISAVWRIHKSNDVISQNHGLTVFLDFRVICKYRLIEKFDLKFYCISICNNRSYNRSVQSPRRETGTNIKAYVEDTSYTDHFFYYFEIYA